MDILMCGESRFLVVEEDLSFAERRDIKSMRGDTGLEGRKEGRKVGEGSGCPRLWVLSPSPLGGIGGGWKGLSYRLPITI